MSLVVQLGAVMSAAIEAAVTQSINQESQAINNKIMVEQPFTSSAAGSGQQKKDNEVLNFVQQQQQQRVLMGSAVQQQRTDAQTNHNNTPPQHHFIFTAATTPSNGPTLNHQLLTNTPTPTFNGLNGRPATIKFISSIQTPPGGTKFKVLQGPPQQFRQQFQAYKAQPVNLRQDKGRSTTATTSVGALIEDEIHRCSTLLLNNPPQTSKSTPQQQLHPQIILVTASDSINLDHCYPKREMQPPIYVGPAKAESTNQIIKEKASPVRKSSSSIEVKEKQTLIDVARQPIDELMNDNESVELNRSKQVKEKKRKTSSASKSSDQQNPPTDLQTPHKSEKQKKNKRQPSNSGKTPRKSPSKTQILPPQNQNFQHSVTRCICDFAHDDGFMICCDECNVWQHIDCMGLNPKAFPENYYCEVCLDRVVDKARARGIQMRKISMGLVEGSLETNNTDSRDGVSDSATKRRKSGDNPVKKPKSTRKSSSGQSSPVQEQVNERSRQRKQTFTNGHVSPSSLGSPTDSAPSSPNSNEVFNLPATGICHYSQELRARIKSDVSSGIVDVPEIGDKLWRLDGNCLKACRSIKEEELIIEFKGKFKLLSEFQPIGGGGNAKRPPSTPPQATSPSQNLPVKKLPLHPFTFFLRIPSRDITISIDCREYGNEARFVRRSCNPNSRLSHVLGKSVVHVYIESVRPIADGEEISVLHEGMEELGGGWKFAEIGLPCSEEKEKCKCPWRELVKLEGRKRSVSGEVIQKVVTPAPDPVVIDEQLTTDSDQRKLRARARRTSTPTADPKVSENDVKPEVMTNNIEPSSEVSSPPPPQPPEVAKLAKQARRPTIDEEEEYCPPVPVKETVKKSPVQQQQQQQRKRSISRRESGELLHTSLPTSPAVVSENSNVNVNDGNVKLTREERKLQSLMKLFDKIDTAQKRKESKQQQVKKSSGDEECSKKSDEKQREEKQHQKKSTHTHRRSSHSHSKKKKAKPQLISQRNSGSTGDVRSTSTESDGDDGQQKALTSKQSTESNPARESQLQLPQFNAEVPPEYIRKSSPPSNQTPTSQQAAPVEYRWKKRYIHIYDPASNKEETPPEGVSHLNEASNAQPQQQNEKINVHLQPVPSDGSHIQQPTSTQNDHQQQTSSEQCAAPLKKRRLARASLSEEESSRSRPESPTVIESSGQINNGCLERVSSDESSSVSVEKSVEQEEKNLPRLDSPANKTEEITATQNPIQCVNKPKPRPSKVSLEQYREQLRTRPAITKTSSQSDSNSESNSPKVDSTGDRHAVVHDVDTSSKFSAEPTQAERIRESLIQRKMIHNHVALTAFEQTNSNSNNAFGQFNGDNTIPSGNQLQNHSQLITPMTTGTGISHPPRRILTAAERKHGREAGFDQQRHLNIQPPPATSTLVDPLKYLKARGSLAQAGKIIGGVPVTNLIPPPPLPATGGKMEFYHQAGRSPAATARK